MYRLAATSLQMVYTPTRRSVSVPLYRTSTVLEEPVGVEPMLELPITPAKSRSLLFPLSPRPLEAARFTPNHKLESKLWMHEAILWDEVDALPGPKVNLTSERGHATGVHGSSSVCHCGTTKDVPCIIL